MLANLRSTKLLALTSIVAAVGVGGVLFFVSSDDNHNENRPTEVTDTYRLCDTVIEAERNIHVTARSQTELVVRTGDIYDPADPAILVGASALVDARDGDVLQVDRAEPSLAKAAGTEADIAAFDRALASISQSPLDRGTAPWPYAEEKRSAGLTTAGPYAVPASGIYGNMFYAEGNGGGGKGLNVYSCQSRMTIYDGGTWDYTNVAAEDRAAFERFASDMTFR